MDKNTLIGKEGGGFDKRTICEVLREIYWSTIDQSIREKTIDAMTMAKNMDAKLRTYKSDWDKGEWEQYSQEKAQEIARQRALQYINEKQCK